MKIRTTGRDGTTEREVPDQILTFREGEMWIAAWRHYDVVSQGKTEAEALERIVRTMGEQCMWDALDGRKPYENVKPPPADVAWRSGSGSTEKNTHGSARAWRKRQLSRKSDLR